MNLHMLKLNSRHPRVRQDLQDVQQMHRTLQDCVAGVRVVEGLMWQVVPEKRAIVVQALTAPDFTQLPEGYATVEPLPVAEPAGLTRVLTVVNPSKTATLENGRKVKKGIRVPALRREWFERRLAGVATVQDFTELHSANVAGQRGGDRVQMLAVRIAAVLNVHDREGFDALRLEGVGRGKAYGCGLLWVPTI